MQDHFTNHQIDISSLPSIDTISYNGLHKDYLTAVMIRALIFWVIFLIIMTSVLFLNDQEYPYFLNYIALGILLIMFFLRLTLLYVGFHKKKYALREKDILYKQGFLWRSNTVIPFNRIQHAEVSQGPIERLFELSVLRVFTAGGSTSDIAIPGIRPNEAHRVKDFILSKTAHDEEE